MSTPFADVERLIGAGTMSLLANATASIAGGAAVPCIYANQPAGATLDGGMTLQQREVTATVAMAAAGAAVRGAAVVVVHQGITTQWRVQQRVPHLHEQQVELQLEEVPS